MLNNLIFCRKITTAIYVFIENLTHLFNGGHMEMEPLQIIGSEDRRGPSTSISFIGFMQFTISYNKNSTHFSYYHFFIINGDIPLSKHVVHHGFNRLLVKHLPIHHDHVEIYIQSITRYFFHFFLSNFQGIKKEWKTKSHGDNKQNQFLLA